MLSKEELTDFLDCDNKVSCRGCSCDELPCDRDKITNAILQLLDRVEEAQAIFEDRITLLGTDWVGEDVLEWLGRVEC